VGKKRNTNAGITETSLLRRICRSLQLPIFRRPSCIFTSLALWTRLSSISIQNTRGGVTRRTTSGNQEEGSIRGSDVNSDNARLPWERFGNVISIKSLHSHMRANILKLRQRVCPCTVRIVYYQETFRHCMAD
jgi:hypothetical protein